MQRDCHMLGREDFHQVLNLKNFIGQLISKKQALIVNKIPLNSPGTFSPSFVLCTPQHSQQLVNTFTTKTLFSLPESHMSLLSQSNRQCVQKQQKKQLLTVLLGSEDVRAVLSKIISQSCGPSQIICQSCGLKPNQLLHLSDPYYFLQIADSLPTKLKTTQDRVMLVRS